MHGDPRGLKLSGEEQCAFHSGTELFLAQRFKTHHVVAEHEATSQGKSRLVVSTNRIPAGTERLPVGMPETLIFASENDRHRPVPPEEHAQPPDLRTSRMRKLRGH